MNLTVEVDFDNAAYRRDEMEEEIEYCFNQVIHKMINNVTKGVLLDTNDNIVGKFEIER